MSRVLACLLLLLLAVPASAATIHVAKDGTGDYQIIADAVDAAAAGDTVRIAAGVYPEVRTYDTPGGLAEFVAQVDVAELTILGAGAATVVIGPETPAPDLERGPSGIVCSIAGNVRVSGLTFRNLSSAVWGNDEWLEVSDCVMVGNYNGVNSTITGRTTVRGCEIRNSESRGIMVFSALGATGATVENCVFEENWGGVDLQPQNCVMRDCSFTGGIVGAQVSFGGSCVIERCRFVDNQNVGLAITNGAQVLLSGSEFIGYSGINVSVAGLLEGLGNVLEGGWWATIEFYYSSLIAFHNNHILNAGGWSVRTTGGKSPVKTQDFENNYWGTTDPAQLDAWIYDRNDDSVTVYSYVDYEPMAENPIPTETTSFGELKARYAPR